MTEPNRLRIADDDAEDVLAMVSPLGLTAIVRLVPGDDPIMTLEITGPAEQILDGLRVLLAAWPTTPE